MYQSIIPHAPTDAAEAIRAYERCRERAEQLLSDATNAVERREAQFWIDNADRNLFKWLGLLERPVGR